MVYYLKINEDSIATIQNLREWLIVLSKREGAMPVIVCDNPTLLTKIVDYGLALPGMRFISSERTNPDLIEIADVVTNSRWKNAGFAHLTVFLDAKKQGYESFWNIDADDTHICLSYEKTAEALEKAETDAKENGIALYSLDMHTTRTDGLHWSFGITYTDNSFDWISLMKSMSKKESWFRFRDVLEKTNGLVNVDMFFTYLKHENASLGIETFYLDHTYFIHYSTDFLGLCIYSGVYFWEGGVLHTPILSEVLKFKDFSHGEKIGGDVRRIDAGIQLEDSLSALQAYIMSQHEREGLFSPADQKKSPWKEIADALDNIDRLTE